FDDRPLGLDLRPGLLTTVGGAVLHRAVVVTSLAAGHLLRQGCSGTFNTRRPRRRKNGDDGQQRGERAATRNHRLHCLSPVAGLSTSCSELHIVDPPSITRPSWAPTNSR